MSDSESSDNDPLFDGDGDDEEIDEDLAFTKEDQKRYGAWFDEDSGSNEDTDRDTEDGPSPPEQEQAVNLDSDSGGDTGAEASDGDWLRQAASDDEGAGSEDNSEGSADAGPDAEAAAGAHKVMLENILQGTAARKHARPAVVSETVAEDEFNVGVDGNDGAAPLTVQDLLAATELSVIDRKSLVKVANGSKTLTAALPKRIRERQERKAAYDVSKKKISEWTPLVRANREVATLHLKRDDKVPKVATAAGLASRHEAVSAFEQEVADLLKQAGHTSTKAITESEEQLATQAMTSEELKKRQDAMARNSALLFYHEQKAKRLKKIKSKAYHRHLKKQTAKARAALGTNDLDDPAALAERAEEDEFKRAKERLTLKHRNTSRWARRALKRGVHLATDEQRDALHEQLRLGRELRSTPAAGGASSESDPSWVCIDFCKVCSSDESQDEDSDSNRASQQKLTSREKLVLAEAIRTGSAAELEQALPTKGLFAMPFMRRALKQQAEQVAADAEDMLRADDPGAARENSEPTSGRQVFGSAGAGAAVSAAPLAMSDGLSSGGEDEDEEAAAMRLAAVAGGAGGGANGASTQGRAGRGALSPSVATGQAERRMRIRSGAAKVGIAGVARGGDMHMAQTSAVVQVSQQRQSAQPLEVNAPATQNRGEHESSNALDHAASGSSLLTVSERGDAGNGTAGTCGSSREANEAAMLAAFAGDDVAAEFERDKEDAMQESAAAVEEPTALPGWGTWANAKREPKWLTDKKAKAQLERKRLLAARADAKLKGVILSEKWDKRYQKYTTPKLPFPYSQPETYEKSMRAPLGRDTNTESVFREGTRPAVLKQTGQIIQPLQLNSTALLAASHKRKKGESVLVIEGGKMKSSKRH